MTEMPSPGVWLVARGLTHVGKYRWLYGLFAAWLAVIAFVPIAGSDSPVAQSAPTAGPARTPGPTEPAGADDGRLDRGEEGVAAPAAPSLPGDGAPAASGAGRSPVPTGRSPVVPGNSGTDDGDGVSEGETNVLSIPPPPPLPLPPVPGELVPALRVASPLAHTACSPVGLAGVVISVAGPAADPVPAGELAAYLTPLYVACAQFPQYAPRSVCEADAIYAEDATGGLLPPPAIVGIAVDTIKQIERLLESVSLPGAGMAAILRGQLNCMPAG